MRLTLNQLLAVRVHDEFLLFGGESRLGEIVRERHRIGETLGVRPIGAEQQMIGTHDAAQLVEIVLVERRHPHVCLELLHRVVLERCRSLAVDLALANFKNTIGDEWSRNEAPIIYPSKLVGVLDSADPVAISRVELTAPIAPVVLTWQEFPEFDTSGIVYSYI